jgi:hypothetical protein
LIDDDPLQEATLYDDRTVSSAFLCIDCCNVVTEIGVIFLFLKMKLVAGVQNFVLEKMYLDNIYLSKEDKKGFFQNVTTNEVCHNPRPHIFVDYKTKL